MTREILEAHVAAREAALDRVRHLLIRCTDLAREPDELDPDTALFGTGLGLDSVDAVEILINLEAELGVRLPEDRAERLLCMRSINSLVDLVLSAPISGEATHAR